MNEAGRGFLMNKEDSYRSKLGLGNCFPIALCFGLALMMIHFSFAEEGFGALFLLLMSLPFFLIIVVFFWFVFFKLKYVLKEDSLLIERFFTKQEIFYSSVKEIKEASDFGAYSMGYTTLSMDQICIGYSKKQETRYGSKYVTETAVVSPVRKEEFLQKLSIRCGLNYCQVARESKEKKELTRWAMASMLIGFIVTFTLAMLLIFLFDKNWEPYVIAYLGSIMSAAIGAAGFSFQKKIDNNTENKAKVGKYKTILTVSVAITAALLASIAAALL